MSALLDNPLLSEWKDSYGLPPFAQVKHFHYKPAIEKGFEVHFEEIKAIATNGEQATFENTIVAFDRAGGLLGKFLALFSNQCSSEAPPDLQKVQLEMAAPLAEHNNSITTYPGLYERIKFVYDTRNEVKLNYEQMRLVERVHLDFVRAGAQFDAAAQARYKEIMMQLAQLTTEFAQNVLLDESSYTLELTKDQLGGLPDDLIAAARQAAIDKGKSEDSYVITLSRSLVEPFLTFSDDRALRETAWRAWITRGQMDASRDNAAIIIKILKLRREQAQMHGYNTFADYATADTMAQNKTNVQDLLIRVWNPAKLSCAREQQLIENYINEHNCFTNGEQFGAWDWRYYAEKIRKEKYSLDSAELKPYFPLNRMCEAIFDCAHQLFGLRFVHQPNIQSYHPDVQTYEVRETDENGNDILRAIFLHDNFARSNKQGGAWMSEYRTQTRNLDNSFIGSNSHIIRDGNVIPIIVNNNNFAKASNGQTLLSYDDARTLFHEFGHGLHGMLSDVTYERLAGTSVLRDFVELPSQLYEHWLGEEVVLKKHARHFETGEPIPDELINKLKQAHGFNKGFETIEYVSSALVDQALHSLTSIDDSFNVNQFEESELARIEMPANMVMRHRPTHFLHLFASSSYAAAYYVYLWAEVLDADGFDAFKETGDVFNREVANRVRKNIYSAGNSIEPGEAYRRFRGRDPVVEPMLKKKALM